MVEGQEEYMVKSIINHDIRKKGNSIKTYYLIEWEGYGPEYNTWEPESNLTCDGTMENSKIQEYWDKVSKQAMERTASRLPRSSDAKVPKHAKKVKQIPIKKKIDKKCTHKKKKSNR